MERGRSDPEHNRVWYSVTFTAGAYWSISLLNRDIDSSLIIWGPLALCLCSAAIIVGRISMRALAVASNLFAMFCIGLGVGYGLEVIGLIHFFSDRLRMLKS